MSEGGGLGEKRKSKKAKASARKMNEDGNSQKKRQRTNVNDEATDQLNSRSWNLRPDYLELHGQPAPHTVSIAVPASIIEGAKLKEMKTLIVGQIARAASMYRVQEIIVFDDCPRSSNPNRNPSHSSSQFMYHLLQYIETPAYLRKQLFARHPDLQFVGLLDVLDTPHQMRKSDVCMYREGCVVDRPVKEGQGSLVNVGLDQEVRIDRYVQPHVRVTVKLENPDQQNRKSLKGTCVSMSEPMSKYGVYWGYSTRVASSFTELFDDGPFREGYDLLVGVCMSSTTDIHTHPLSARLPQFSHALVVFGGVGGIPAMVESDESLQVSGANAHTLFDRWLNPCPIPAKGLKSVRTEDAVLMSLTHLWPSLLVGGHNDATIQS